MPTSTSDRKGAATDSIQSLTAGTNRLSVTEDRSLCREGMSAVRVTVAGRPTAGSVWTAN